MNFRQRLSRYGIGIFIGVLLSLFFFSGRGCGKWLPGNRVMQEINEKVVHKTPRFDCLMQCYEYSEADFEDALLSSEVVFPKSETRANPRKYYIEGKQFDAFVLMSDSGAVFTELFPVSKKEKVCGCD